MMDAALDVGSRPALLVVDVTRALTDPEMPGAVPAAIAAVGVIAELLVAFRRLDLPVIYTRGGKRWHTSTGNALTKLERGAWLRIAGYHEESSLAAATSLEIAEQIQPQGDETVVTKSRPSAFFATPLPGYLLGTMASSVVIVGMMTSGCVRATVTDAFSHDLDVIIPADALADRDETAHAANLRDMGRKYATVSRSSSVIAALDRSAERIRQRGAALI